MKYIITGSLLILLMFYLLYPFKPIIIQNDLILDSTSIIVGGKIDGLEFFYPFTIVRDLNDQTVIRHELIHFKQIQDSLPIVYHLLYLKYYINNRMAGMNHNWAYLNICFELEAYAKENDKDYWNNRIPFSHFLYLR